jgi:hypothetical protein
MSTFFFLNFQKEKEEGRKRKKKENVDIFEWKAAERKVTGFSLVELETHQDESNHSGSYLYVTPHGYTRRKKSEKPRLLCRPPHSHLTEKSQQHLPQTLTQPAQHPLKKKKKKITSPHKWIIYTCVQYIYI